MNLPLRLATAAALFLSPAAGAAGERKDELKIDPSSPGLLRTGFATYGYLPPQSIVLEKESYRFRLPAGVARVGQTGVYSYFLLSGDCEVSITFELINLQPPREGYGSGVGLAFDAGEEVGRASIQRVDKNSKESGYVLQTSPGRGDKVKEEYRFVPTPAWRGRIGMRRVKKELVFLASDDLSAPLKEVGTLPFTDGTVRSVRFFADPGGSPTALDVRVGQIQVRAEEITGGVPRKEAARSLWLLLWVLGPVVVAGLLFWRWRAYRGRVGDDLP